MSNPGTPTIDQVRAFLAVVETGGFAAAGRKLNRAVSVVSYGVTNLETQLGLRLFERERTKKPVLTVEGRAVLGEVRAIGEGVDKLRAKVKDMLEGLEAEVNIALDVMLLPTRINAILRAFYNTFPTVSLRIHVEAPGVVTALVQDKVAVVGVSGPVAAGVGGLHSIGAGALAMVPVAAPDHPLARMDRIALGEGRSHTQLVLADRSRPTEARDFSVLSTRIWSLEDLGTKHLLLKEGVGWGNMPLQLIESDLATGALVRLQMPDHPASMYRFAGVWRPDLPPGPAARWLLDQFVRHFASDIDEPGLGDIREG